ncbi:MAG: hypothetical protein KDA96_20815 [Planctomycetaceae bacterium]|nr:hypothetical protein [Planctomycetaceae bacterium]
MQRAGLFFLFAVAMFGIGTVAGQVLRAFNPSEPAQASFVTFTSTAADKRVDSIHRHPAFLRDDPPPPAESILTSNRLALSEDSSSDEIRPVHFDPEVPDFDVEPAVETQPFDAASEESVEESLRIVTEFFPDEDPELLRIWAVQYAGMPAEEVRFILEQKQRVSGFSLRPGAEESTESQRLFLTVSSTREEALDGEAAAECVAWVEDNLRNTHTIGFRRRSLRSEPDSSQTLTYREVRSFEPGVLIASADSLHVALPPDSELMFSLDQGALLTRRGDFCLLENGSIGLRVRGQEYELLALPEDVRGGDVSIRVDGTVVASEAGSTEERVVGAVPAVSVTNAAQLDSVDGVFFSIPPESRVRVQPVEAVALIPQSLELSNVNRDDEWQLLDHLSRLQKDRENRP